MKRSLPRPIGFPLLPLPDDSGQLSFPTLEQSVRQMIEIILSTRPGEQLMRPEFGGGLDRFLYEPNQPDTHRRIREQVLAALGRNEPRIVLERVDVAEAPERPSHVRVEIAYRLRRTGVPQRLGLTVEVGG